MTMPRLTKKQKIFCSFVKYGKGVPNVHLKGLRRAEVSDRRSNQADFIMRLLDRGVLRLELVEEEWETQR